MVAIEESIRLLRDLVAIQSVSSDPNRSGAIVVASEFISKYLKDIGFSVDIVCKTGTQPLVVANYKNPIGKETIGVYAHYDVQPEDPVNEWDSPPFELTLKNGKMYGRGVADDKGHIAQTLIALKDLINSQKLVHSIVLLFEGEEEISNNNFENLLAEVHSVDLRAVSSWFVLDMGMKSKNLPQIFTGLRGIVSGEISIRVGGRDVHSGIFGNRIYNAAQALTHVFGNIKDQWTGEVHIPGFYDDIQPISQKVYDSLVLHAESELGLIERSGANALVVKRYIPACYPQDMPVALTSKLLPSFEINGIWSGYTGTGAKTIIPATAHAKFSIRTVVGQNGKKIMESVESYLKEKILKTAKIELEVRYSEPVGINIDNEWVDKTCQILNDHFGQEVIFNMSGGSIPAVEILYRLFGKPVIMTGFTLPDENIHSPNENIDEDMFFAGIEVLKKLFGST